MNSPTSIERTRPTVSAAINAACGRIAPTWPLDQFIAVNPYWGWRGSPASVAAASLGVLGGTALTMPRSWFREEWSVGRLNESQLIAAAGGDAELAHAAHAALTQREPGAPIRRLALVTDVRDRSGAPRPGQTWSELVTHQIGQHCAAHFDRLQGTWHPDRSLDLFAGWRVQRSATHGVPWNHGSSWAARQIESLPTATEDAIDWMLHALDIEGEAQSDYLTALLLSINGWAAWCAYERWQARLVGADDHEVVALLAVRLAWEWLLRTDADGAANAASPSWSVWAASWSMAADVVHDTIREQQIDWVLQSAVERTYQASLIDQLGAAGGASTASTIETPPTVQAVFCIDVRSEVFRRSLEGVGAEIQTRGFAGFFGLPISYTPAGSALTRPQLPGLLSPALAVSDGPDDAGTAEIGARRASVLGNRQRWNAFRSAPSSVFSFVESMGLLYGSKLIKASLAHTHGPDKWEQDGVDPTTAARLRPRLGLVDDDPVAAAAIAHRVLSAMGLVAGFAPVVLLCGHGSQSANNPHAAGLDCGACGGQTGEVNARVLADLLNTPAVRSHLVPLGIDVPDSTWFLPALHNTTTDQVQLFDTDLVPSDLNGHVSRLEQWLWTAGVAARAERAVSLGLGHIAAPEQLERTILERANDWSQVRPEWGLAGNAAFIVAPRSRTRHMDLGGRSFLHDYNWQLDPELSTLTLIMTAPMVVTNWINMQYHASTVDNRRYGSGNKVLHNVVAGRLGVFEGNGGDLRIGLAMQSLHDGANLQHPPLRLSVFIEAPRAAIDAVVAAHEVVYELVANEWLHLLRIEPADGSVECWTHDGWVQHS
jgi:uncharacterized protein